MLFLSMVLIIVQLSPWIEADFPTTDCKSQSEFVKELQGKGFVHSRKVADVLRQVDRKYYLACAPYIDLTIAFHWLAFDLAPKMQAFILESLKGNLKEGNKVLDIGFGSGYLIACMALMVGQNGLAVGLEKEKVLVKLARKCYANDTNLQSKNLRLKFVAGNLRLGYPEYGPYDAINVALAVRKVPKVFLSQLKAGGRMVIRVGRAGENEEMTIIYKRRNGTFKVTRKRGMFYIHRLLLFDYKSFNKGKKKYRTMAYLPKLEDNMTMLLPLP